VVGAVKRIHLTQTYELTITVDVDVPDTFTAEDMINALTDFPINATVESLWYDLSATDDVPEITVGDLCVDSLISLNGLGTTVITDENGDTILQSV
jgi:hypothetical protein